VPPLPTFNRFHVLSVDEIKEEDSDKHMVPVAQPPDPIIKWIKKKIWECQLPTRYVVATTPSTNSLSLRVEIETTDSGQRHAVKALVDCGATGLFVDARWVQANGIPMRSLSVPVAVYSVDGTLNEAGAIREVVMVILQYGEHKERATFAVTKLGGQDMLLGLTWLRQHNPEIDWRSEEVKMMRCPPQCDSCQVKLRDARREEKRASQIVEAEIRACRADGHPVLIKEVEDEDDPWGTPKSRKQGGGLDEAFIRETHSDLVDLPSLAEIEDDDEEEDLRDARIEAEDRIFVTTLYLDNPLEFICVTGTVLQRLAEAFTKNADEKSFRDVIPESLHEFGEVFAKESFDSLPERRKWDHVIELERKDELLTTRKVYPMSLEEQKELDTFLEEALSTGRIRPSKSPIGMPVFFVKKKDGKLRFVQDYRALNAIT
jgi:hypothetical protein